MSHVTRKPVFGVSDQVRHKPGCSATEDVLRGLKFQIQEVEGFYYLCSETNVLISCAATTQLIWAFVLAYAKSKFSHDTAQMKGTFLYSGDLFKIGAMPTIHFHLYCSQLEKRLKDVESMTILCYHNSHGKSCLFNFFFNFISFFYPYFTKFHASNVFILLVHTDYGVHQFWKLLKFVIFKKFEMWWVCVGG